jgi:hypothetical protein
MTQIRYTFANGHIWNGTLDEVEDSIALNGFDRHRIFTTVHNLEVGLDAMGHNEVRYNNGDKIEVTFEDRVEVQSEINVGGF